MSQTQNLNRTDKFLKNVIASAILQLVTIITGFISPRLMLTAFGSEINGITSSITQFVTYLTLVEAGLSNATIFALYKPLANHDIKQRDSIISASRIAYYRVGFIFVALSVVLALVYPFIGEATLLNYGQMATLVIVLCGTTTINFFVLAKYRTLLTADQCGYAISLASSVQLVLHLILIYIGIKLKWNVVAVRALGLCSLVVTSIILAAFVRFKYGKINYKAEPNMKALDKRWDAMFLQLVGVVATGSPVVIMTAILDYKLLSVYAIYNMIAGSITRCISVFTSGLGSAFGDIYASGDEKLLKKTTEEFRTAFYILITIVYSIMMATIIPFVRIYTRGITDVNYIVPLFGVLITLNGLIENFRAPHGMLVYSFGKFKKIKRQTVTQAVIIVVLTIVFTKLFGLVGSMMGLCAAGVYMLIEMLILAPKELVNMSVSKNVRQIIQSLVIVFVIFFAATSVGYKPTGYLSWLIYACVIGIVSVVITVVSFALIDREDFKNLVEHAKLYIQNGAKKFHVKSK